MSAKLTILAPNGDSIVCYGSSLDMQTLDAIVKSKLTETTSMPMQPIVKVGEVVRFKKNGLVDALYEHGVKTGLGMNELSLMQFSDEERMQFAQLIGYSVSGYGNLSYVSDESANKADAISKEFVQ